MTDQRLTMPSIDIRSGWWRTAARFFDSIRLATKRSGGTLCVCTTPSRSTPWWGRTGPDATRGSGGRPEGRCRAAAGWPRRCTEARNARPRRSCEHGSIAAAECGRWPDRVLREGSPSVGGHSVCALSLDCRRRPWARDWPTSGWLGESRPERRCHRGARAQPAAHRRSPRRRSGHRSCRPEQLGTGEIRRGADPRRQGVPTRRPIGGNAPASGVWPGWRESPHVDRMGRRHALERVRRQPRNARPGDVLRPAAG